MSTVTEPHRALGAVPALRRGVVGIAPVLIGRSSIDGDASTQHPGE